MYLVMQLQGNEIERVQLLSTSRISKEIEELKKKHNNKILKAKTEPQFYITEVPSAIDNFNKLPSHLKGQRGVKEF